MSVGLLVCLLVRNAFVFNLAKMTENDQNQIEITPKQLLNPPTFNLPGQAVGLSVHSSVHLSVTHFFLTQKKWWKTVKNEFPQQCRLFCFQSFTLFNCPFTFYLHKLFSTIFLSQSLLHNLFITIILSRYFIQNLSFTIFLSQYFFLNLSFTIFYFQPLFSIFAKFGTH